MIRMTRMIITMMMIRNDKDDSMVRRVSGTAGFLLGGRAATQGMYDTLAPGRKDK